MAQAAASILGPMVLQSLLGGGSRQGGIRRRKGPANAPTEEEEEEPSYSVGSGSGNFLSGAADIMRAGSDMYWAGERMRGAHDQRTKDREATVAEQAAQRQFQNQLIDKLAKQEETRFQKQQEMAALKQKMMLEALSKQYELESKYQQDDIIRHKQARDMGINDFEYAQLRRKKKHPAISENIQPWMMEDPNIPGLSFEEYLTGEGPLGIKAVSSRQKRIMTRPQPPQKYEEEFIDYDHSARIGQ